MILLDFQKPLKAMFSVLKIKSKFKALEKGHRIEAAFAGSADRHKCLCVRTPRSYRKMAEIRARRLSPGHRRYGMKSHTALIV